MPFAWPWLLPAVLAGPLVALVAWLVRRRRRRAALHVTSIVLVRAAVPARSRWRRWTPAALLFAGLAVLGVGAARPHVSAPISSRSSTILLAMDVSISMCSTDVEPNRLTVAQQAATEFVESQRGKARIGLVTFAGFAALLVPPTDDTGTLVAAIDGLSTARGTAIGQAILTSIDAIAEVDPNVAPVGALDVGVGDAVEPQVTDIAAPDTGYAAEAIVILTDGANSRGVRPEIAAAEAKARRLRVYTIGFGTTEPAGMVCDFSQLDGDGPLLGGEGGFGRNRQIDEESLTQVAGLTGGEYFKAENAGQLQDALAGLPSAILTGRENRDIAAWLAAAGGALVVTAVGLSQWWNRARRVRPA